MSITKILMRSRSILRNRILCVQREPASKCDFKMYSYLKKLCRTIKIGFIFTNTGANNHNQWIYCCSELLRKNRLFNGTKLGKTLWRNLKKVKNIMNYQTKNIQMGLLILDSSTPKKSKQVIAYPWKPSSISSKNISLFLKQRKMKFL